MMKIQLAYYQDEDVLKLAKDLLGKLLLTNIESKLTGGIIVETEAYKAPEDRASHAFNHRRTTRNEMMYAAGGVVYMYVCYGMRDMLNVVTGKADSAHAVLIRAIEPTVGIEHMQERRGVHVPNKRLCQGPGSLCKALGLTKAHNGTRLHGDEIWLEDHGKAYKDDQIAASARIGLNFEGLYKTIPWRFYVDGSPYVSKPNISESTLVLKNVEGK